MPGSDRLWTDRHAGSIVTASARLAGEMAALGDTLIEYVRADTVGLPEGWRVERVERNMDGFMPPEVEFELYEPDADVPCTKIRAREDRRQGEWTVMPGSQSSWYEAAEARARAAVLVMAAEEVELRNGR